MPNTIATPSNNDTKVRFQEPYVSAGLNQKLVGPIPEGVIRGGSLVTSGAGLNVQIEPDPNTGDSVYTYTTPTGFQLTHRESGIRVLDLTAVASSTVYICLFIEYIINSPTVVEWRTYSEAELFGGGPVAEAGSVVIVGRVVVPAAGPISATNVSSQQRREAWANIARGLRSWSQVIQNSSFTAGGSDGTASNPVPGHFTFEDAASTLAQSDLSGDVETPRTGGLSLRYEATGAANLARVVPGSLDVSGAIPYTSGWIPVKAGQLIDVSFYLAGESVEAYTSGARCILRFRNAAGGGLVTATFGSDPATEVGTFTWTRIGGLIASPVDGFVQPTLSFGIDLGAQTGKFFVDDWHVYLQPQPTSREDAGQEEVFIKPSMRATEVVVSPRTVNTQADVNRQAARLVNDVATSGPLRGLLSLLAGDGVQTPEWITPYISSAIDIVDDDYGVLGARFGPGDDTAPTDFKLLHRYELSGGVSGRVYSSSGNGYAITVNARWDAGASLWRGDDTAINASKFEFQPGSVVKLSRRNTVLPAGWADGAWDSEQSFEISANNELIYSAAKSRTSIIPLASGTPRDDGTDNDFALAGPNLGDSRWQSLKDGAEITFPIRLPQGAVLQQVRAIVQEGDATGTMNLRVFRHTPDFGTPGSSSAVQLGATATSSGTGVDQLLTVGTIAETIDNSIRDYFAYIVASSNAGTTPDFVAGLDVDWDDPGPRNH